MGPIVEVHSRTGRVLSRQRLPADCFSVGRAYNNDLLLDDPYVKENDVNITAVSDGQWQIVDEKDSASARLVASGEEFFVGKTRLKIFHPSYEVAPARLANDFESNLLLRGRWLSVIVFMLVALMLQAAEAYVSSSGEVKWPVVFSEALLAGLGFVLAAGFWALLSRLLRHEDRFLALLIVLLKVSIVLWTFNGVFNWLGFNLNSSQLILALGALVVGVLTAYYLYACLVLATSLARQTQKALSIVMGLLVMSSFSVDLVFDDDKFSPNARYNGVVYPPALVVAKGVKLDDYIVAAKDVFTQADAEKLINY